MSSEEGDEELGIKPGVVIASSKQGYVVINLLGEGGFGAVYKVHQEGDKTREFAMKVEKKLETRKHSKLKMEIAILKLVGSARGEKSHFTRIQDRGKKANFFFLVMQLVGKSLADLKLGCANKVFSIGTGLGVGAQCLEAVEDLHSQGFIHRDLKPANYACGLGEQKHVIYILDFGIARRVTNTKNEMKTPRDTVGFKGTVRFASLACHRNQDMGKKDDCESWFYLLMDLIQVNGLPWRKMSDKTEVKNCKEKCRVVDSREFKDLYHGHSNCCDELCRIIDYVDGLKYQDPVDYPFFYLVLQAAGAKCGVKNIDGPFDWELDQPSTAK